MIKVPIGQRIFNVFNIVFMGLLLVVTLYPFYHVLMGSLSDATLFAKHQGPMLLPKGFSLEAYRVVLNKPEILTGYTNTLIYVVTGVIVNMSLTISFAYVLSRPNLYWNRFLTIMVVVTMYFGGGLIPTYLVVKSLGLINTRWAVILPTAIQSMNLIILKTAFASVPVSLEEAAKIDGAGPFDVMWRIIIPLSLPTISVLVLYYAVSQWNSWFQAMLYLRSQSLYPLQLYLREILIINEQRDMLVATGSAHQLALGEIIKYATIIISTVPILCVYPFLQKYFTKGVLIGAVKG